MTKLVLSSLVGLILLVELFGCRDNDEAQTVVDSPDISDNLPPVAPPDFGGARLFQLEDLNGRLVSLNDFRDQVVAINFWATWCNPCREEIPDLVKIQDRFRNRGFIVLGLSRDLLNQNGQLAKNEEGVESFVEEFNINYPVLWDTENIYSRHYDGIGMPTTIILDRHHRIRFRHTGIIDSVTLDAEIIMLLNEA
jgi:thiol-disulfide isomerase/thioredoxin